MEFRQINYFLSVAYFKNFSKAAAHLFITQPTLSQQISELESELGVKLFNRTNRTSELTPAGQAFLKEALVLKEQYSRCISSVSTFISNGALTIGKIYSFEPENLILLIHTFIENYPTIKLNFNSYNYDELVLNVTDQSVDAAFVVIPDHVRFPNIEHVLVGHDRLSIIVPKRSQYGHITSVYDPGFKDLLTAPMFLHKPGYYYDEPLEYLREINPRLNINYANSASSISIDMATYGGFTILHEKWFFSHLPKENYTVIQLPDEIGLLQVSFIYNKNNPNPCIYSFMQEVVKTFREKGPVK